MFKRAIGALVVVTSLGACGDDGGSSRGDSILRTRESALAPSDPTVPYLDFDRNAPDGSIALTFDDGPDVDGNTAKVLDVLLAKGVTATFFINSNNCVNVEASTTAIALVQRMVAEGHEVGNHTYHHYDLGNTATDVRAELDGVDDLLHAIAPAAFHERLVRAPYGNPYYSGPQSRLDYVAPIAAEYGVHIGWNIDARDASSCTTQTCVHDNVIKAVDAGKSGIVLLHSIEAHTAAALPSLIDDLQSRGKRFVTIESMVVAKYGKPSRQLFTCRADRDCIAGELCGSDGHCAPATTADAGTDAATSVDSTTPDTAVADSFVPDTFVPDTFVPDTRPPPDTAVADTYVAAADAIAVVDSGVEPDASDTNVDDASLSLLEPLDPQYGSAIQPVGGVTPAAPPMDEPAAPMEGSVGCQAARARGDTGALVVALAAVVALRDRRRSRTTRRSSGPRPDSPRR